MSIACRVFINKFNSLLIEIVVNSVHEHCLTFDIGHEVVWVSTEEGVGTSEVTLNGNRCLPLLKIEIYTTSFLCVGYWNVNRSLPCSLLLILLCNTSCSNSCFLRLLVLLSGLWEWRKIVTWSKYFVYFLFYE